MSTPAWRLGRLICAGVLIILAALNLAAAYAWRGNPITLPAGCVLLLLTSACVIDGAADLRRQRRQRQATEAALRTVRAAREGRA